MTSSLLLALLLPFVLSTSYYQNLEERIVNGVPISASEYPWTVSIRMEYQPPGSNNWTHLSHGCGGSLIKISPPTILTVAHCFDIFQFNRTDGSIAAEHPDLKVLLPAVIVLDFNRTSAEFRRGTPVDRMAVTPFESIYVSDPNMLYIHPKYGVNDWEFVDGYDIALFIIDDGQTISSVQKNELPELQMQLAPAQLCCDDKESLITIGYGANETDGPPTKTLEMTRINYVNPTQCVINYGLFHGNNTNLTDLTKQYPALAPGDDNRILCAIGNNTSGCWGDIGGPLFRINDVGKPEIVGINSFPIVDNECNSGYGVGYTISGVFYDWIMETIDDVVPSTTADLNVNQTKLTLKSTDQGNNVYMYHFNVCIFTVVSCVASYAINTA